jgi:hypothetical protein
MTGAPDGDVDRALASMGATPLKYYSFGVVAVRPPELDRARSEGSRSDGMGFPFGLATQAGLAPPLPPSGEGTSERYRSHSVASVFPLLGLALPEAFHIDVEPVWPVGPPVSEQSVIFDRSTSTAAIGALHARHEASDHSKFATNVEMFPQEAVKSSPVVYATPPDGESQFSSTNGGVFVMPAWLDPASAANGPLTVPANPLPWLDNPANAAPPAPGKPSVTPNAVPDWVRPPAASPDPQVNHLNDGGSVYSPFVQNGVAAPGNPLEKPGEFAAHAEPPLPHWLQDTAPPATAAPEMRHADWSVPDLNEHPVDAQNPQAAPETLTGPAPAHPMPAFAPPSLVHTPEPQPLRSVVHEERSMLPESISHEHVLPKASHEVAYPFSARHNHAGGVGQEQETHFPSQLYPLPESDAEPTWHEPPFEAAPPNFVEVNRPHFATPETTNDTGPASASFPGAFEFGNSWGGSPSLPGNETSKTQAPPAPVEPTRDVKPPLFAALPAVNPPTSAPKPASPAASRPLADLFRTLGGSGSGGSEPPRSVGRKEL